MNEILYQLKESFLQEWPLSRVKSMTLEEYTNLDKNSFCYWLEAKTHDLGSIWGGSSYKFGVYKRRDINTTITVDNRITDGEYAWFQKYGVTKENAFQTVNDIIIDIIENAQNNTLENIDSIDLGDAYKWKIAFLYGDFNVVNIFKNDSLVEAAQSLGYRETSKNYADLNRFILSKKPSEQDYFDFTAELWKKTTLANATKYWLYAPGENASKWEEFYSEGIMGLGWDQLGDLDQYASKKDIKKKLQEIEGVESSKQNDTAANFEFHKVIKEGDIVIVKKGISELLGYGVVTSDYFYDENRASYQKCRKVDWKLKGSWKVDFNLPVKTLTDVTKYPTEDPNYSKYYERLLAIMDGKGFNSSYKQGYSNYLTTIYGENSGTKTSYVKAIEILSKLLNYNIFEVNDLLQLQQLYADLIKEQRNTEGKYFHPEAPSYGQNGFYSASIKTYIDFHKQLKDNSMNSSTYKAPLNQILYGPPGTGKTYNTINKALEIINDEEVKALNFDNREAVKDLFEKKVKENQIDFTTFHQSMSYEDFIEGIKPETKNEKVTYAVKDGIFKTITKNALIEYIKDGSENESNDDFENLYNDFIENIKPFEGKREGIFKTKTGVEIMLVNVNKDSILIKYLWSNNKKVSEGQHTFSVTKEKLKRVLVEGIEPNKIKNLKTELHPLVGHIHCELFAVYKKFYDFVIETKGEIDAVHFDNLDLTYEEVKEQFDKLTKVQIKNKLVKPYVLIIDEINRGNVSQIFGELITLIEDSKRLGKEEALEVTLPYSKEKFGVPPNLYIIGTMNTADRSVEAIDTALRRRFSFVEMMPDEKIFHSLNFADTYDRKGIMQKINQRIEVLLDRNYTLGHSYFIKEDFENSFENEIIPLLQEYFYNDYGKIGLVLGKGFVREKAITAKNDKSIFADFDAKNEVDINKSYELIPFTEINFDEAIQILLA